MKKLISICLTFVMLLTTFPMNALAAENSENTYGSSDEQVYIIKQGENVTGNYDILADGEWTFVERNEHTITWEEALISALVVNVAGKIASKVPYLSAYGAQITIGTDALSIIVASCNEAKVVVEFYTLTFPGQPIQYMYKWTFKPVNGSTYGPYRIVIDNQVASIGGSDELQ